METPPPDNHPLAIDYDSTRSHRSRLATAAMILGIVGAATSIVIVGVLPGIAAIILGIVASTRISRNPQFLSGKGYANLGIGLGCLSCLVPFGVVALLPCMCGSRPLAYRSACAANMRSIAQSMCVYASDNNDAFPVLPYAPYGLTNSGPSMDTAPSPTRASGSTAPSPAMHALYVPGAPLNGSPLAAMWLLVQNNYISPKQFLCKSDPFVSVTYATLEKSPGVAYLNVQKPDQLSYAFAYPYASDGTVGNWWKNTTDSSLPIAADMPPLNGTGKGIHNVAPGALPSDPKSWNSPNHEFDGQNVAFADGHAEFLRRPDIGQSNDNLFTYTATKSVSQFGGIQPTPAPITINTNAPPYDIALAPARNLNTGGTY